MLIATTRSVYRSLTVFGLVSVLLLGVLLVSPPAQAQRVKSDYFGMHDGRVSSGSLASPELPIGSVRLWDSGTSWREIETSPGYFDFGRLDTAVQTARAQGARPTIVLGQTPSFHAQNPSAPGSYGEGASSMPKMAAWKTYVGKVAARYQKTVDYQVWNEPNVIQFWTGKPGQMAKLTAAASRKIRGVAGAKAKVVAPSFVLRLKSQQKWYSKYWASKVGGNPMSSFINVVSVNLYPAGAKGPEASMNLLKFARKALPKAARKKPMWNTEINYGMLSGGADGSKQISEAKQAAYVARTLVLNPANGIRRVYWYTWNSGSIANTHLVESDGATLTRAGRAWGVTRSWILGTNLTKCVRTATGNLKGLYTCTAYKGKTEVRRIYWKPSGTAVRVTTHKSTKSWTDLSGATTARKGAYKIKVGQLPVMVASRR